MRSVRNSSFARLVHPGAPGPQTPRKWQFLVPFLGALLGGLVSLGGVWLQHSLSNTAEVQRAEREALLDTLTLKHYDNKPDFIVLSDMAMTSIRYATYSNADTLKEQAAYLRKNKFCENQLTEECKRAFVEQVAFSRRQLGLDAVSLEDLRVLLDHPLRQLETVRNRARAIGVTVEGDRVQR